MISPHQNNNAPPHKKVNCSLFAIILALALAALFTFVILVFLPQEADEVVEEIAHSKKIVEATPISSATNSFHRIPVKEERPLSKRERDLKQIRDLYGDNIPDNLKAVVYFLENPPQKVFKVKNRESYFRHPSERRIAGVAFAEPGTYFVVKPEFDDAFDRDFVNALVDNIEINDDDSDEVKAGKEAMTALKKEIADICRSEGKSPSEVMNEHASAMYDLGRYQRDLETELENIHTDPDYSDEDVEDFCTAANKLLESKGLPAMPYPDLTRRSIHIQRAQRQTEKRTAREQERMK